MFVPPQINSETIKQTLQNMIIQVICDVTPLRLGNSYRCFREACCPNLQGLSSPETFALVTLFQDLENQLWVLYFMPQDCCLTTHYPIPMLYIPENISLTYFRPQHIFLLASSLVVLAPCLVHPPSPIQSLIPTATSFPPVPIYTPLLPQGLLFYPEDGSKRFL